jgi:APA family basic amino acid/polyamine antiporter
VIEAGRLDGLAPLVDIGAGIAALGVLLNLIPGVSRTTLAMAREGELPRWFAHIDPGRSLPLRAELTVAAVVIALVVALDVRSAIGISGVAVLTYYAITNAAALTLRPDQRRWPRAIAVVGFVGCVVLVVTLPLEAVVTGITALAVGIALRQLALRHRPDRPPQTPKY